MFHIFKLQINVSLLLQETEKNLLNALMKQHFKVQIMFPYFFR